jgi:hypothetical protein
LLFYTFYFTDKQAFLYNEKLHGLQVLFEHTTQEEISFDDKNMHRWLDKLSLEILDDDVRDGNPKQGPNSVFVALLSAFKRQGISLGNVTESWMSLKQALKLNISNSKKSTKVIQKERSHSKLYRLR